jgi:hypothetical protein
MGYEKIKLSPLQAKTLHVDESTIGTLNHRDSKYIQFLNFTGIEQQFYFNKCSCNESRAIVKRHCLGYINDPFNDPAAFDFQSMRDEMYNIAISIKQHFIDYRKMNFKEVIENTRISIRQRYRRARENIINDRINLGSIHSNIRTFIKYEKMDIEKLLEGKPPRLIQYRSYEYLYLLKAHLLPYAKFIKETEENFIDNEMEYVQPIRTVFTKTMTFPEMAIALKESFDSVPDCVILCLDHSKFDGHCCEEILECEQWYFNYLLQNDNLKKLLSYQLKNKCRTQNGIKYKTTGHRMSGEYNTSDGNSIINYSMLRAFMRYNKCKNFKIHVNGDDSLIMLSTKDYNRIKGSFSKGKVDYFERFNMETKLDRVAFDFRLLSYCQMSPIRIEGNWTMIKTPYRAMSRFSYAPYKYINCIDRYIAGISLCELAVSSGVPILQSFVVFNLLNSLTRPLGSVDKIPAQLSTNSIKLRPISMETRLDFEAAFGIDVLSQMSIEKELEGLSSKSNPQDLSNYLEKYQYFHQH